MHGTYCLLSPRTPPPCRGLRRRVTPAASSLISLIPSSPPGSILHTGTSGVLPVTLQCTLCPLQEITYQVHLSHLISYHCPQPARPGSPWSARSFTITPGGRTPACRLPLPPTCFGLNPPVVQLQEHSPHRARPSHCPPPTSPCLAFLPAHAPLGGIFLFVACTPPPEYASSLTAGTGLTSSQRSLEPGTQVLNTFLLNR